MATPNPPRDQIIDGTQDMSYEFMSENQLMRELGNKEHQNAQDRALADMRAQQNQKAKEPLAINHQEGGRHYKEMAIQPVTYIHANKIGYFEGNVIKYVSRWKEKNGIEDLKKAKHYLELLIELEQQSVVTPSSET